MASGLSDISALLAAYPEKQQARTEAVARANAAIDAADRDADEPYNSRHSLTSASSADPSISPSQICSASQYGQFYGRGGGDGRKRRGNQQSSTPQLCNSRLTQATMVGLVVVMSICLVAMCTLYVLDWYNRTYVYSHHTFIRHEPGADVGHFVERVNWLPPVQPLVRPLLTSCVSVVGAHCPTYCCGRSAAVATAKNQTPPATLSGAVDFVPLASPKDVARGFANEPDNQSQKPLASGARIELVDLHAASIDAKFCVGESCEPRKGRYNLYVPMSAYMPTMPVHLKFG